MTAAFQLGKTFSVLPNSLNCAHTASVIFLHGLGDTGQGWCSLMENIKRNHIKYICPTAPVQSVTLNLGFKMPAWYDIHSLEDKTSIDMKGLVQASGAVAHLIEEEMKNGISAEKIILGGFSQGGSLALFTAFTMGFDIGGVAAFSTYFPMPKGSASNYLKSNLKTPILHCHGTQDEIVSFDMGRTTAKFLNELNPNHEFKTYNGVGHHSCEEEMNDLSDFVDRLLPA